MRLIINNLMFYILVTMAMQSDQERMLIKFTPDKFLHAPGQARGE